MPAKNKEAKGLILAALEQSPGRTKAELLEITGLSDDIIQDEIGRLRRTGHVKADQFGRRKAAEWYLMSGMSILDRIEAAVKSSDKPLNYREIAAALGIEQKKTANPLSVLAARRKIIKSDVVRLTTSNAASTYIHADNLPSLSSNQGSADNLNMSLEAYEGLIEKELGEPLCDAEFRNWINVYYAGSKATAQFIGN